jgi:hypothetical protein
VNERADNKEDRYPWKIHDCHWAGTGEERADLVKVSYRLLRSSGLQTGNCNLYDGLVHGHSNTTVKQGRGSNHDARADDVKQPLKSIAADQEHREGD